MDIPKLEKRILEIAKTYKGQASADKERHELSNIITPIISGILKSSFIKDPQYWKKGGIRVEDNDAYNKCLEKVKLDTKSLGVGYYGEVFDVPADSCIKNIPKGVKHVAMKVETLKDYLDINQTPLRIHETIEISKAMNKMKIGPAIYDVFVLIDKSVVKIIKVYELIEGTPWKDMKWTKAERHKAMDKLLKLIQKMNKAGIIHGDLHAANVMVGKSGIYIIDYDLARYSENYEDKRIGMFNDPVRWEDEVVSNNEVLYVYDKLVKDGNIKFSKTRKAKK